MTLILETTSNNDSFCLFTQNRYSSAKVAIMNKLGIIIPIRYDFMQNFIASIIEKN